MTVATIKDWLPGPGYGFAARDHGPPDIFVHETQLPEHVRATDIRVGLVIDCKIISGRDGRPRASNIAVLKAGGSNDALRKDEAY